MRIAFIGTRGVPASYSGFETCVEQVGRRMVERGHEVTVYCRRRHFDTHAAHHLGMRLVHLPSVHGKHLDTLSHTFLSAFRLPRNAAVICMGVGNAPVVRMLEMTGRRVVFNTDGADWRRDKWGRIARTYLQACESLAAGGRGVVVADAAAVASYYQTKFGRPTELVAYGADPPNDTGTQTLDGFGLAPREYLLLVGRLVPENGIHDYLEGARLAGLKWPAVVVGDAPFAERYIEDLKVNPPPGTVFTGYQFGSAYQQLTAHAGIYVLAASVGGTHPVLVEQMVAGNCILARETESNREVLAETGLYWRTPAELAELLSAVAADGARRASLGKAARLRALKLYDWEAVTSRYLELCESSLRR
jgi:glycosyltransferase involved in cell wall biosynthesis